MKVALLGSGGGGCAAAFDFAAHAARLFRDTLIVRVYMKEPTHYRAVSYGLLSAHLTFINYLIVGNSSELS